MPLTCPYCKENCVEEDGTYIQEHLICTACGAVIEEGKLTSSTEGTAYAFHDQNVSLKAKGAFGTVHRVGYNVISEGLKQGLKAIDVLVSKFRLSLILAEETRELFKNVLQMPTIKFKKLYTKTMVAACCVYVVLRQNDWPISLVNICQGHRCAMEELSPAFSLVVRAANIKFKQAPIEEVVESNLRDMAFDLGERTAVVKRTIEVIQLASKLWITTGRSSKPLVIAASFLAWKSFHPEHPKMTYTKFCRLMKVDKLRVSSTRVVEITAMLLKLGAQIPWVDKEKLTTTNIGLHLTDILKYSNTLQVEQGSKRPSQEESTSDGDNFKRFRFPGKRPCKVSEQNNETATEGSNEINDEEIDQYIRTQEEVDVITQLYQRYEKDLELSVGEF